MGDPLFVPGKVYSEEQFSSRSRGHRWGQAVEYAKTLADKNPGMWVCVLVAETIGGAWSVRAYYKNKIGVQYELATRKEAVLLRRKATEQDGQTRTPNQE